MFGRFGDDVETWKDDDEAPKKKTIPHAVIMIELLTTWTRQKSLFISNLFKLTEAEYRGQNVIGTVGKGLDVEDDLGVLQPIELDEDGKIRGFKK